MEGYDNLPVPDVVLEAIPVEPVASGDVVDPMRSTPVADAWTLNNSTPLADMKKAKEGMKEISRPLGDPAEPAMPPQCGIENLCEHSTCPICDGIRKQIDNPHPFR